MYFVQQVPQYIVQPQVPQVLVATNFTTQIPQVQQAPQNSMTITQDQMLAYSRYIPPTPTTPGNAPAKIYQFYQYVPVNQLVQQGPQYQTLSSPVVGGSYIIQ